MHLLASFVQFQIKFLEVVSSVCGPVVYFHCISATVTNGQTGSMSGVLSLTQLRVEGHSVTLTGRRRTLETMVTCEDARGVIVALHKKGIRGQEYRC